jgi:hypothetical protein
MSLLGEEIIEEWLNRKGYFTIRGIKIGMSEIDLLAIKPLPDGKHECRHLEVQLSRKPMSYFASSSAIKRSAKKRSKTEVRQAVKDWIDKKFNNAKAVALCHELCDETWKNELVIWNVHYEEEIDACEKAGITVHRLKDILSEMLEMEKRKEGYSATGRHLFEILLAGKELCSDSEPTCETSDSGVQRLLNGKVVAIEKNR